MSESRISVSPYEVGWVCRVTCQDLKSRKPSQKKSLIYNISPAKGVQECHLYNKASKSCEIFMFVFVKDAEQCCDATIPGSIHTKDENKLRFSVCFHLWCELTTTISVTEWQVSWNSCLNVNNNITRWTWF